MAISIMLLDWTSHLSGTSLLCAATTIIILLHLVPYFIDRHGIRSYPGPLLAKFSKFWLARAAMQGRTASAVHEMHEKYGIFVRISPNEVSIADPEALQAIYGHSSGTTKSSFYNAFATFKAARSVFSTQSREDHTRKRKLMAHTMSAKALSEFESVIYHHERTFIKHWDEMCDATRRGLSGRKGDSAWAAKDGRAWVDAMPWFNYKAFDIISDLAFGVPFGMLNAVKDTASVVASQEEALASLTSSGCPPSLEHRSVPAVQTVNDAATFNTLLGCLPEWTRPLVMSLPAYRQSFQARKAIGSMAISAVSKRIEKGSDVLRYDFITKLLESRDVEGKPMASGELAAESVSFLVAGSDTTSNTAAAITYYLAQNRAAQAKLQQELDKALGSPDDSLAIEDSVTEACLSKVRNCQYLHDVINEGLRMLTTACFGLPRAVPEGGLAVLGHNFAAGTVLSAPMLTLNRLKSVWGQDADVFNPDRWATGDKASMQRAFAPFSIGPRACLGRNLADLELTIFVSTIFHRYDVVLGSADQKLDVHEAFLRKPLSVQVGIKLRESSTA